MLTFIHRTETPNVGDLASSPMQYIEEFSGTSVLDIMGWNPGNQSDDARDAWYVALKKSSAIIVGGGGLLTQPYFEEAWRKILENRPKSAPLIGWGIGHNAYTRTNWRLDAPPLVPEGNQFELLGLRYKTTDYDFVPCASCMSPLFDENYPVEHDVVYYAHHDSTFSPARNILDGSIPQLSNTATMQDAIRFLASGALVLTDSYHGQYWATLLRRRVITFPWSSKFYDSPFPSPQCRPDQWMEHRLITTIYPRALTISRDANKLFKNKISRLLHCL